MNQTRDQLPNTSSPDAGFASQKVLINLLSIPLSVIIVAGNLVIIAGIVGNRRLHNATNYYFLSLLLADLCTGLILPSLPRMSFRSGLSRQTCFFFHLVPNFIFLSFLANLLLVHCDRYVCIVWPLHYHSSWVQQRVLTMLLAAWALPLLFASLPLLGWNHWTPGTTHCYFKSIFPSDYIYLEIYGLLIPTILAISAMTVRLLLVARRQLKAIQKVNRSVQRASASLGQQHMDIKYAKCVVGFFLIFLVCWVPYMVYIHVSFFQRGKGSRTHIVLSCLGTSSAALIPFVLALNNRQYFKLWTKLFRRVCDTISH
uniref:G-protein coupled bile acid receptor 1-like n=1 Tax=Pristiophorus japonicus TaxID=55135 RepID=UPI00398E6D5E